MLNRQPARRSRRARFIPGTRTRGADRGLRPPRWDAGHDHGERERRAEPAGSYTDQVEVTLACVLETALASCLGSVWVTDDRIDWEVTRQASDAAGNRASATVRVSVDRTPPRVTLFDPEDGTQLSPGATRVTLRSSLPEATSLTSPTSADVCAIK